MKLFACLLLSLALSNVAVSQRRMVAVQKKLTAATTQVKGFFLPSERRYSGWQNIVAGLTIAGIACLGVSGCSVRHSEKDKVAVKVAQHSLIWGGLLIVTPLLLATQKEVEHIKQPSYALVSLAVVVGGVGWLAASDYVDYEEYAYDNGYHTQQTLEGTFAAGEGNSDLRTYLREHLAPQTYKRVLADTDHQDGWLAVPVDAQLLASKDPLAALVNSIEQAEAVYYGRQLWADNVSNTEVYGGLAFKLDTVKHSGDGILQPLAEDEIFSVVMVEE